MDNFIWDPATGRYRNLVTGRFVSFQELRQALDTALRSSQARMLTAAARLRSGSVSVSEWARVMRDEITNVHLYGASLARGGWAQLTASELSLVQSEIYWQLQYLERFIKQIEDGLKLDGRFTIRVGMYANAARHTYDVIMREVQAEAGKREERNLLHPADHCAGCLEAAEMGWVPLGTLPLIGERDCYSNCRCTIEYR
jgi:hypothetical protein